MKSFVAAVLLSCAVLSDARAIVARSCSGGGAIETLNFDGSTMTAADSPLNVTGYHAADPSESVDSTASTNAVVSGLKAVSAPNLAFTGASDGAWPNPTVPVSYFNSTVPGKTFSVQSFYFGSNPGTRYQVELIGTIPGSDIATSNVPVTAGADADGNLQLVDVASLVGFTGLQTFAVKALNSGKTVVHAIDNFTIQWDC